MCTGVHDRWAAYPPEPHKLDELFKLGYTDTMNWLMEKNKLSNQLVPNGDANGDAVSNGSTNGLANGHVAQSASDTDSEEPMDQKPLWRQIVAQTACEAPSCDESLKEAVSGKPDFGLMGHMIQKLNVDSVSSEQACSRL